MATKVMRMPSTTALSQTEVFNSVPVNRLRERSIDYSSAAPLHTDESIKLETPKASSRSLPETSLALDIDVTSAPGSPTFEIASQPDTDIGTTEGLDELVSHLNRTGIQTAAPITSRKIEIPKGYELGMAFNIAKFYDLRAEFRRLDKRKRDLGIFPRSKQAQKHGFRPEELIWEGALELKDCKASSLTNEIHPLLSRDAFDDTPDHVYDQLVPGLRLATQFLSHPACMQFWVTLAKGERKMDHEMSRRCGNSRHRISRNVPMTKENNNDVIDYMKKLGRAKAVHFTFAPGLAFEGDAAFGTARTICDYQTEDFEGRQHGSLQCSNVRLHSDFYVIAKKLSTMKYPDPAQKLRFNFIFASLIVHELAHAIELSQWKNRALSLYEPFLLHHNEAELGRMWESYIFGGQVAPINDRVDGIYGVATWNWPRSFGEMDPERTICHAVPMKYIQDLQQMDTWEKDYPIDDWRAFHIPRGGATSIYMNSVTTVPWTEEERVAKEILQEQQLQDLEEPARKKRETADGHAVAIENGAPKPERESREVPQEGKGTAAQQVNRVKKKPHSVLSKKQRRAQKKMEQKAMEKKQADQAEQEQVTEVKEETDAENSHETDSVVIPTDTPAASDARRDDETTNDEEIIEAESE
ncbi:MAG: hypothetical protein Q9170_007673 [Blastenia crenularia]